MVRKIMTILDFMSEIKMKDIELVFRADLCGTYQIFIMNEYGEREVLEVDFTSKKDAMDFAKNWVKNGRKKSIGMEGWKHK